VAALSLATPGFKSGLKYFPIAKDDPGAAQATLFLLK